MNKTEIKNFLNCKMKDVDSLLEHYGLSSAREVKFATLYNETYLRFWAHLEESTELIYINCNFEAFIRMPNNGYQKLSDTVRIPVSTSTYTLKESVRILISDLPLYEYCEECGTYHLVSESEKVAVDGKKINRCCLFKGIAYGKYVRCKICNEYHSVERAFKIHNTDRYKDSFVWYCRKHFNEKYGSEVVYCPRENLYAFRNICYFMYDGTYEREHNYVTNNCVLLENGRYAPKELCVNVYMTVGASKWMLKTDFEEVTSEFKMYEGAYYKNDLFTEYEGQMVPMFKLKQKIYSYHSWNKKREFMSVVGENTEMYFGAEIETCGSEETTFAIGLNHTDDIFHCEHDGSLDEGGYEIISQPMTMNYWKLRKEEIGATFNKLIALGQRSDETSCCGLHIHVSRKAFKDEEAIKRAVAIVTGFKQNMEVLARRKNSGYYAYQMINGVITKEKVALEYGHYTAVNCGNTSEQKNTIEFRIFKGTLNINTFFATLELVKNIVDAANSDKKRIIFSDLLKGEYLPAYVETRISRGYTLKTDAVLDLQGWNQEEVKRHLQDKWDLIKKIKDYNLNHPETKITSRAIFGGAC